MTPDQQKKLDQAAIAGIIVCLIWWIGEIVNVYKGLENEPPAPEPSPCLVATAANPGSMGPNRP